MPDSLAISCILKFKNKMNMKSLIKYGFIAVVLLSFMSCNVENYEWKWAKEVCKNRDGVHLVEVRGLFVGCRCNNGHFEWKK